MLWPLYSTTATSLIQVSYFDLYSVTRHPGVEFVGFQIRISSADSIVLASWTFIAVWNNFMLALKPVTSSSSLQCQFAWFDQRLAFMSATWPDHSLVSTHDRAGFDKLNAKTSFRPTTIVDPHQQERAAKLLAFNKLPVLDPFCRSLCISLSPGRGVLYHIHHALCYNQKAGPLGGQPCLLTACLAKQHLRSS